MKGQNRSYSLLKCGDSNLDGARVAGVDWLVRARKARRLERLSDRHAVLPALFCAATTEEHSFQEGHKHGSRKCAPLEYDLEECWRKSKIKGAGILSN